MTPQIYWLPMASQGRLAIMPRPRGGEWLEDDLKAWAQAGVQNVVSLLTSAESRELDLQNEATICGQVGLHFASHPIPDRQTPPTTSPSIALIREIDGWLDAGQSTIIHCRMGIGRSAMLAACVMEMNGLALKTAFATIARVRGVAVPDTDEQREWATKVVRQIMM
jgi:protein-tyrosine phosphatase